MGGNNSVYKKNEENIKSSRLYKKFMEGQDRWYLINGIEEIDSPGLVIYSDRVKKNIDLAISMIGDVNRLRPHVKTHKSPDVTSLLLQKAVTKFKCATIAEAEMLGTCHAPDVLLAYQPSGPKVQRLIRLIKEYPDTKYSCLVDNLLSAQNLASHAKKNDIEIPVYIDLNVGMNRTGIEPGDKAFILYQQIGDMKGIEPVGLHAYDGHISDQDFDQRKTKCEQAFASVEKLKSDLKRSGVNDLVVVAGGSPTFPIHIDHKEVECSPGTFVYWDASYHQSLSEQHFLPAALVISRVISKPGDNLLCLDLGHKSIAAENPLGKWVKFINSPEL